MRRILLVAGILLPAMVWSQRTGFFDKTLMFNNESRMLSAYVPANYSSAKNYHLIVALHGLGDNSAHYLDYIVKNKNFDKYFSNVIIVCPDGGEDDFSDFHVPKGDEDFIDQCLQFALDSYSVDPKNVLLQGFSLGGRSALKYGLEHTDKFSALLLNTPAVQGPFDANEKEGFTLGYAYENGSNLPIYMTVGLYDRIYTEVMGLTYQNLVKGNARVQLNVISILDHDLPEITSMGPFLNFYNQQSVHDQNLDVTMIYPPGPVCRSKFNLDVLVRNTGAKAMNGFVLEYTTDNGTKEYEHTGSLGSYEHALVTIPGVQRPHEGEIAVSVKSINGGDQDPSNLDNSKTITFSVSEEAVAIMEGFEDEIFPPRNWTHHSHQYPNAWSLDQIVNNGGEYSIYNFNTIFIFNNKGARDELITYPIELGGTDQTLKFDYAFNYHSFTPPVLPEATVYSDTLEVSVSYDCGATYEILFKKGGDDLATFDEPIKNPIDVETGFTSPGPSNWKTVTLPLKDHVIGDALIKFTYISGLGGTINIDNVLVDGAAGVQENLLGEVNLHMYPNPARSAVNVSSPNAHIYSLMLYSTKGSEIKNVSDLKGNEGPLKLSVHGLEAGVYIVKIETDKGLFTRRLVVDQ